MRTAMDRTELAELNDQDAQAVCEALGRYEDTLHNAVREIHVDIQVFKRGVDQQVDDMLKLVSPLSRTVSDLQQENQQLRTQLERLSRQVELLSKSAGLSEGWSAQKNGTGPSSHSSVSNHTSASRFSSVTLVSVPGKGSNADREENEIQNKRLSGTSIVENGQPVTTDYFRTSPGFTSPQHQVSHSTTQVHSSAVSQMPHLPVTAVTRLSERFSAETSTTSAIGSEFSSQSLHSKIHQETGAEHLNKPSSRKSWSPSTVKTMGSLTSPDKSITVTKSLSSASSATSSGIKTSTSSSTFDSYCDVTPKSQSPPPTVQKRRELVRSQTLPRTLGTQARKAMFEKLDFESGKGRGEAKPKLKRSQSFGVSSASGIKQILLEWCRSKTIGYKKIDIQNFSSSWSDGMAFCALVHSFFPEAFDYDALSPSNPKENFEMAFTTAEKLAQCDRLIEVDDMLLMGRKPDPMCVFTYVQSLYNHLRRFE